MFIYRSRRFFGENIINNSKNHNNSVFPGNHQIVTNFKEMENEVFIKIIIEQKMEFYLKKCQSLV